MEPQTPPPKTSRKILRSIGIIIAFIILSLGSYALYDIFQPQEFFSITDDSLVYEETPECNVLGINLHGTLLTYVPADFLSPYSEEEPYVDTDMIGSEEIVGQIESGNNDDTIKGFLIEIDSAGGSPVAGEEIANALKNSSKPSVVIIRSSGLSAAYWAATGADYIFASKNSDVGSIGVTMSYLEEKDETKKYVDLSSGEFKDAGSPYKPLTEKERELFMRDINIIYKNFIEAISENRGVPIESIESIADGSSVLGEAAKSLSLIDEIGSWNEAKMYLSEQIGEKPEICWF